MFPTFVVASLLASSVLAQSSGSATATASPLVPTGISASCSKFLNKINADTSLEACTSFLIKTTANYGPSGNLTGSPTSASISSVLGTLCSDSTCSKSTIRTTLADFYTECTVELTSSQNKAVLSLYDTFYALVPFKAAICTKGDSGTYCATETSSYVANSKGTTGVGSNAAAAGGSIDWVEANLAESSTPLTRRAEAAIVPNMTTFTAANVPWMFLRPELQESVLCVPCTRKIVAAYLNWESEAPYAPGLVNSALLSGQSALYSGIKTTCGDSFFQGGEVQAAGSLSDGSSDAAPRSVGLDGRTLATVILGVIVIGVASFQ